MARIKERPVRVRDTMTIHLGDRKATVKRALIGIRDRFHVEVDDAPDLKVHGNMLDHEYEVEQWGTRIATIAKKWVRVRETLGVEVQPDVDAVLILAVVVAIDHLTRD